MKQQDNGLTIAQAARMAKISRYFIIKAFKEGRLQGYYVKNTHKRITREELNHFIEQVYASYPASNPNGGG